MRMVILSCVVLGGLLVACTAETPNAEGPTNPAPTTGGAPSSEALVKSWIGQPEGTVLSVEAAKKADSGTEVTVVGRVRRVDEVWALFELTDMHFEPCSLEEGCKTPWDYCCEDQTEVAAGTLSVEFRDGPRPHKVPLLNQEGLDHCKKVTVAGVTEKDDAGNVIVIAKHMHIED